MKTGDYRGSVKGGMGSDGLKIKGLVSFWREENVFELDRGDSCTTL